MKLLAPLFGMLIFAMTPAMVFAEGELLWQSQQVSAWVAVLDSAFSDEPAPLPRQWYAAYALGQYGEAAKSAVPAMLTRLETAFDRDNYVRAAVARSLGMIGDSRAVPVLAQAISQAVEQDEESVPRNASWALGTFGPAAAEAVPVLEALLTHPDFQTRAAAAAALWQIARHEQALKTLVAMIRNSTEPYEIYEGEMALAQIGPSLGNRATAVVKLLVQRVQRSSSNPEIPLASLEALCAIGQPAVPEVKSAIPATENPQGRARLVTVLGTIAAPANAAMLLELADDAAQAEAVRIAAVRAIPRFPADGRTTARDVLVRIINDTTSPPGLVREAAELMKTL